MEKGGDVMTYACENCGFLFYRVGEVQECPSCEKNHIRFATKEESQRLNVLLEQGESNFLKEGQNIFT